MDVIITGRKLELTDPIRLYTTKKTQRLSRYYDRLRQVEVILDKAENADLCVEMIAHAERVNAFVAHAVGPDLYHCIDDAATKLERQLVDHKDKLRNRKHPH